MERRGKAGSSKRDTLEASTAREEGEAIDSTCSSPKAHIKATSGGTPWLTLGVSQGKSVAAYAGQ